MTTESEWTVDLANRRVTHASGASASFYRYPTEADWLATDSVNCSNVHLYSGLPREFARRAKEIAIEAGMRHH
jgi:predicted GIY-YIG superfamily endonuclease